MTTSIKESSYIRFLNCVKALDTDPNLDSIQMELLDFVILAQAEDREILMGDLLALAHLGSLATLHSRIKKLNAMGYLELITDAEDNRKKKIFVTKLSMKYYDKLSKCLLKSIAI